MSNLVHSIQDRLRQIARRTATDYQMVLIRYFQERFLFRLSISQHNQSFCLKGGALLYAWNKESSRLTLDLDLEARGLRPDQKAFESIFYQICELACQEDCVVFDTASMTIEDIKENDKYAGLRVKVIARLGNIRQNLQIDIGFGDVITPAPLEMQYPVLLEMPPPCLMAYSIETVMAEKFEAMISLAELNSRMKDFYDLHRLLLSEDYDRNLLYQAISNTFRNRNTIFQPDPPLFQPSFVADSNRLRMWEAFLKRMKLDKNLDFRQVHEVITQRLQPVYEQLR